MMPVPAPAARGPAICSRPRTTTAMGTRAIPIPPTTGREAGLAAPPGRAAHRPVTAGPPGIRARISGSPPGSIIPVTSPGPPRAATRRPVLSSRWPRPARSLPRTAAPAANPAPGLPTPSSGTDIRAWMTRGPRPTRGWRACATTSCATRSRRPVSPATTSRLTTSRGTPNWVAARPPTRSSRTAGPPGISVAATSAASATPVASATASALGRPRPGDSRRRPGTARVAARVSRVAGTPGWVPASRPVPGPVPPGKIPRAISELPPRRSGCSPRPRPGGSRSRPNTSRPNIAGRTRARGHRAAASPPGRQPGSCPGGTARSRPGRTRDHVLLAGPAAGRGGGLFRGVLG